MQISYDKVNSEEFVDYYNSELAPHLEEVEKFRADQKKRFDDYLFYAGVASVVIFAILFWVTNWGMALLQDGDTLLFVPVLILAPFGVLYLPYDKYKKHVKGLLLPILLKFCGQFNLETCNISRDLIDRVGLFDYFNRFHCDDYITGVQDDVNMEIAELHLQKETGSGKNRRTVTIFKGLVTIFSFNKNFKGKTLVQRDAGMFNCFGGESGLKRVNLEDPIFEKEFEVYGSDQIESRYLLTTAFMQRLLDIQNIFNSKIKACFYDDKLMIAIPTSKNFFELPNLFKPIDEINKHKKVVAEITSLTSIVDILKLDQKIGL